MVEERIYLGKVKVVSEKYVLLEPVLFSDVSKKSWEGVVPIDQRHELFPDKGFVFWFKPHVSPLKDSYWEFEIESHPDYVSGTGKKEKYQVRIFGTAPYYKESVEVIDLRGAGAEREIREALTSKYGMILRPAPIMRNVMLWIKEEVWLGPVKLVQSSVSGNWRIEAEKGDDDFSALEVSEPDIENLKIVQCEGKRFVVPPGQNTGKKIGVCNWDPDEQLAKRLLKRIGKLDPDVKTGLGVAKAAFDAYLDALSKKKANLLGADLEQELAREERIRELKALVEKNIPIVDEAVRVFCESEHFKKRIKAIEGEAAASARSEITKRVEEELKGKRAEIESVTARFKTKKGELAEAEKKLRARQEDLERKVGAYDSEFVKRLRTMAEKPDGVFPELAVFRQALVPGLGAGSGGGFPSALLPAHYSGIEVSLTILEDKKALIKRLQSVFHENGFSPMLGNRLMSGFLSGLVPVVKGERAYEAIRLFANCVAGGRLNWIPISGSLFDPQDLFGTSDRSGKFVPHPAGLLKTIKDAHGTPDSLTVVVLDGYDRAPIDSYLLPLMQSRADVGTTADKGLPLHMHLGEESGDADARSIRIGWPGNVLLAFIPAENAVHSPSARFWRFAASVDCTRGPVFPSAGGLRHPDADSGPKDISEILASQWVSWKEEAKTAPLTELDSGLVEAESVAGIRFREEAIRFYSAGIVTEAEDPKKEMFISTILERVVNNGSDAKAIIDKIGLEIDDDLNIAILIKR
jgi:hypothetical protein